MPGQSCSAELQGWLGLSPIQTAQREQELGDKPAPGEALTLWALRDQPAAWRELISLPEGGAWCWVQGAPTVLGQDGLQLKQSVYRSGWANSCNKWAQ